MTYTQLAYLHLATVVPAFVIGALQLLRRKGTPTHKLLGKIYMVLMLATGLITLAMPAEVGPRFLARFGTPWLEVYSNSHSCSIRPGVNANAPAIRIPPT